MKQVKSTSQEWSEFFTAWKDNFSDKPTTLSELSKLAQARGLLNWILRGSTERGNLLRLSNALRKSPVKCFSVSRDSHSRQFLYSFTL